MRIAFYAPMKSPCSPVPSGDRTMARLLLQALRTRGHEVRVVSKLRSWCGDNTEDKQRRIQHLAPVFRRRILSILADWKPQIWFTYHLYHKAPDWLGPEICESLSIPYLVAEASLAEKQATGQWRIGHRSVAHALAKADAVINLNPRDLPGIRPYLRHDATLLELSPFIDITKVHREIDNQLNKKMLSRQYQIPDYESCWLGVVSMFRFGDKLASLTLLSQALEIIPCQNWQLILIGDGEARQQVASLFASMANVHLLGLQSIRGVYSLLAACDLYTWPGINEAYGMAMLEAQACGTPVLAFASGGIETIVKNGVTGEIVTAGDLDEFASRLQLCIEEPQRLKQWSRKALIRTRKNHDLPVAARKIDRFIREIIRRVA